MDPQAAAVAALLVAGHALGDFVFQTRWMVDRKDRPSGVAAHVAVVALCHLVALLPYLGAPVLVAVAVIAVLHAAIDVTKSAVTRRWPARALEWFALDQAAHLTVLALVWRPLSARAEAFGPLAGVSSEVWTTAGILVAAYAFNVNGMSAVVVSVLDRSGIALRGDGPSAGRLIGVVERLFALTMVLLDRWEALGLLVAAKALARFKELDERPRAEYYLVGTLVSLLGAMATGLLVGFLRR